MLLERDIRKASINTGCYRRQGRKFKIRPVV